MLLTRMKMSVFVKEWKMLQHLLAIILSALLILLSSLPEIIVVECNSIKFDCGAVVVKLNFLPDFQEMLSSFLLIPDIQIF